MSDTIKRINEALEGMATEWKWDFAYAPKPGQQRIKITAHSKKEPGEVKVIVLAEDLFKKLAVADVARNIVRLLPSIPAGAGDETKPSEPVAPVNIKRAAAPNPQHQYQQLRENYRRHVVDLKMQALPLEQQPDWTANFGRSVTRFFAGVSRKFAHTH